MIGKVVSTQMKNTVVVEVERLVAHPVYLKRVKKTSRFHADNDLDVTEGDTVRIEPIRPLSKKKYHKVVEVMRQKAVSKKEKTKEEKKK